MKFVIFISSFVFSIHLLASDLAYVKTDSPRDTIDTFMTAMDEFRQGVLEKDYQKMSRIYDAIRCVAEKDNQVITSQREKELAAIFLKEVIDRVIVVDLSKIPADPQKNRWRMRHTELVLKPHMTGDREGEWLITESTWRRANLF